MSGYLQRMAGTAKVARAQARVHPFVEGMYGERSQSVAPLMEEVERRVMGQVPGVSEQRSAIDGLVGQRGVMDLTHDDEAVMGTMPGVSGNPTSQKQDAHPNQQAGRRPRDAGHGVMGPAESEGERFEALLPKVAGEDAGFVLPKQEGEVFGEGVAEGSKAAQLAMRLRNDVPPSAQGGVEEWKFEPVMRDTRTEGSNTAPAILRPAGRAGALKNATAKDEAAGLLPPAHFDKAATSGAPVLRRLAQPPSQKRDVGQPQGDEIQIHIGRIEVIAMPPAAPRPVAAPARKTQTLDEYLRQKNGRTG